MKYPHKLLPGMTVGVIAPCSSLSESTVKDCLEGVEMLGFKVKAAPNLSENYGGYMAGDGELRAEWINRMFADPEVDGIICIRGGDGGTRTVPYLDLDTIRANPKPFVGYSDVTTHHLLFNRSCGFVTFHGPMAGSMAGGLTPYSTKSFFDCINADKEFVFENPADVPLRVMHEGAASGELIGGNLSLLSAAVGTPYDPDTRGKIFFIEEVEEPIGKIEKWMYHMRNSGKLSACSGILFGHFTSIHPKQPDYTEYDVFRDVLRGLDIPVMYNVSAGHGDPKATLPMGAVCHMDTRDKTIVFDVER